MNQVLKIVLSLSLSGALSILLLYLGIRLCGRTFSKAWRYYIWLIAVVRLLLPFAPAVNLYQGMEQAMVQVVPYTEKDQSAEGIPLQEGETDAESDDEQPPVLAGFFQNLWVVWLMGVLVLFIRKITVYQSFIKFIRAGWEEVTDIPLLDQTAELEERLGIKKAVELRVNPMLSSPVLIGFFRPCIVLPSVSLPEAEFQYTIQHELIHYKRRDMFYKWLVQLTICMHWFNPLVYWMGREIGRACELSCDEAVIGKLDRKQREAYGDMLLNAVASGGNYKNSVASVTLHESKKQLKERLVAIMDFKAQSKPVRAAALLTAMALCVGASAVGAYASPVPSSTVIWHGTGQWNGETYTYTQSGYYEAPYIFQIGWNVKGKLDEAYPDKAELVLADGSAVKVSFDRSCKSYMTDQNVMNALKALSEKLKIQRANSALPFEKPLVISVEYVGGESPEKLAEQYYADGSLVSFVAVFPSLPEEVQKSFCDRMFTDGKVAFFAAVLREVDHTLADIYVNRAYQEGKLALYASILGETDGDLANVYMEKAYQDRKLTYFASAAPYLTDDARDAWIARCSRDKRNTYLAVLTREAG
ncbi:M56 family metallopeptidase [Clostridium sp. D33t1_170424_F3]|uniref:M56 family metallopeptidase n=1 Tax=Clostridium sp. D33t1_170424_F3 TaxID=2787099 RepID=UPI0018A94CF9|nr:M56 family metallopeptidase [Clostridium sp. D33t1_170424_F3]